MNPVLHQSFLTMLDYTPEQFAYYLDLAAQLKKDKKEGKEAQLLKGKNFALILRKTPPARAAPSKYPHATREPTPPTSARPEARSARKNPSRTPPACSAPCLMP